MEREEIIREIHKPLSERITAVEKQLSDFTGSMAANTRAQVEIELTDMEIAQAQSEQSITDLEIEVAEMTNSKEVA